MLPELFTTENVLRSVSETQLSSFFSNVSLSDVTWSSILLHDHNIFAITLEP